MSGQPVREAARRGGKRIASLSMQEPGGEWTPLVGVSEIEPVLTADALADALYEARDVEPLTWTIPVRYLSLDETRQLAAVRRVRAGAIAWWNAAQRRLWA